MTTTSHAPPLEFGSVDEALAALRDAGHRVSTARRLIIEALFKAEGPVAADFLARGAGGLPVPGDEASVYRNLDLFERIGLVRHLHAGHGPGLYALAGDGAREYLVCENCGLVRSVEPDVLDGVRATIQKRFGFRAHFGHFPIAGLCAHCTESAPGGEARDHEHSHGDHIHSHPHAHHDGHSHD